MQKFEFLQKPLLGELAMRGREREREKNAIYSGHLRLSQQPRAAHALRSDQHSKSLKGDSDQNVASKSQIKNNNVTWSESSTPAKNIPPYCQVLIDYLPR